jgi:thiol-disulfide isomerase/thioredoxin
MPDLELKNLVNYKTGSARISDFKGKLLILDFWGIRCTSCIEAMPKMEALQKQFGTKIQILMVTKNSEAEVEKLKKRIDVVRNLWLPMYNHDSIISRLFRFETVPTHVWIDEKGVVQQITDGWETTAQRIEQHLKGEKVHLALKEDSKDFDPSVPLWLEGGGRQVKHIKYYSFFTERLTDSRTTIHGGMRDSSGNLVGLFARNTSVIGLFQMAFNGAGQEWPYQYRSRVLLEFPGSENYLKPEGPEKVDDWCNKNLYCYELSLPKEKLDRRYDVMKQDLERFFGLRGSIEKRKVKCLVLKRTTTEDLIKSKSKDFVLELHPLHTSLRAGNYAWEQVFRQLQFVYWSSPFPFLDETNYKGNVDIGLNGDLSQVPVLRRELNKYGLDLVEEERELDMLVIRKAD